MENGTTENEIFGWHHKVNGHEFGETPGISDGQRGLDSCSPCDYKESDTSERMN